MLKLKLKLKTNLYSAMESGGTSRLSSQREYGEIEMFWGGLKKQLVMQRY